MNSDIAKERNGFIPLFNANTYINNPDLPNY